MNEQDMVRTFISVALAGGCGVVIQWLLGQLLEYKAERGQEVSPFTKRWVSIGLSVVVPTALYGLAVWLGFDAYEPVKNLAYVGIAFMGQQAAHSKKLPGGQEWQVQKTEAVIAETVLAEYEAGNLVPADKPEV